MSAAPPPPPLDTHLGGGTAQEAASTARETGSPPFA